MRNQSVTNEFPTKRKRPAASKKKNPATVAAGAGVKTVLQISLLAGYGIAPASASPRRWSVGPDLLIVAYAAFDVVLP